MASHLDEPIWDGNGGQLDPQKTPQRDLIVALHVKMDQVVIPALKELGEFRREQENGIFTKAQELAVKEIVQEDKDKKTTERSLRVPVWAFAISCLALLSTIALTVAAFTGGTG